MKTIKTVVGVVIGVLIVIGTPWFLKVLSVIFGG
jgi:hypothetical protein